MSQYVSTLPYFPFLIGVKGKALLHGDFSVWKVNTEPQKLFPLGNIVEKHGDRSIYLKACLFLISVAVYLLNWSGNI